MQRVRRECGIVRVDDLGDPVHLGRIILDVHQDQLEPAHPAQRFEERPCVADEYHFSLCAEQRLPPFRNRGPTVRRTGRVPVSSAARSFSGHAMGGPRRRRGGAPRSFPTRRCERRGSGRQGRTPPPAGGCGMHRRCASPKSWPQARMRSSSFWPCSYSRRRGVHLQRNAVRGPEGKGSLDTFSGEHRHTIRARRTAQGAAAHRTGACIFTAKLIAWPRGGCDGHQQSRDDR